MPRTERILISSGQKLHLLPRPAYSGLLLVEPMPLPAMEHTCSLQLPGTLSADGSLAVGHERTRSPHPTKLPLAALFSAIGGPGGGGGWPMQAPPQGPCGGVHGVASPRCALPFPSSPCPRAWRTSAARAASNPLASWSVRASALNDH